MEKFVERMIDEYFELQERIANGYKYLAECQPPESVIARVTHNKNNGLLQSQIAIMEAYKKTLWIRINLYINFKG